MMEFFDSYARGSGWLPTTPAEIYFSTAVQELVQRRPGLIQRYLYAGGRHYDMIIYLLSEERRAGNQDTSLAHKAIWGTERLHPRATATQGIPIGFVTAQDVARIAVFFDSVTFEQLHEYYNPTHMHQVGVYKIHPGASEESFQRIWNEFGDIRHLYYEAAANNEAVITVID